MMKQRLIYGIIAVLVLSLIMGIPHVTALTGRIIALPTAQRIPPATNGQVTVWGDASASLHNLPLQAATDVRQIAMGAHHAIALTKNQQVIGWGVNWNGELTIPPTLTDVVQVSVGISHSVALQQNGTVVQWGAASSTIADAALPTDVVQIAAGDRHTVLLRANGSVVVTGLASQRVIPSELTGKTIVAVAAGADSSLALDNTGTIYQWGGVTIPTVVSSDVTTIFAHGNVYGAVRSDGTLIVWGNVADLTPTAPATTIDNTTTGCPCVRFPNMSGVLDMAVAQWGVALIHRSGLITAIPKSNTNVPTDIPGRAMQLGTYYTHNTGIALQFQVTPVTTVTNTPIPRLDIRLPQELNSIGKVFVWGGDSTVRTIPISATNSVIQIVAGRGHIVALRSDSRVIAWGSNNAGQTNVPPNLASIQALTSPQRVIAVAAGANHSLALLANGTVQAWGDNTYGQSSVPVGLTDVVQVVAGIRHSVALRKNGLIVSWGDNTFGQTTVPPLLGVAKIASAGWHTVALLFNNKIVAWGRNDKGQTSLPLITTAVDIAASNGNTVVLLNNGTVQVFGDTTFNQTDVPMDVYQRIGAGNYHILAVSNSGQVQSWGLNTNDQSTPPTTLLNPFMLAGGADFSVALAVDRVNVATPTSTASATPFRKVPLVPTFAPLRTYTAARSWGLGDIPAPSASDISNVAIMSDTIAIVHGDNTLTLNESASNTPLSLPDAVKSAVIGVGVGDGFGVVLKRDHTVAPWGIAPTIPLAINRNINEIAVNGSHVMLMNADGNVWSNQYMIPAPILARHIAAGRNYAVVLLDNGVPQVWSADNTDEISLVPDAANNIIEIAAGTYHILGLRADGRVIAWGAAFHDRGQADVPYLAQSNVVAIAAGDQFSIALRNDGQLVAWGDVPVGTATQITNLSAARNVVALRAGAGIVVALTNDADVVGTTMPTRIATAIPLRLPTLTPRAGDGNVIANLLGWFTMGDEAQSLQYVGVAGPFACTTPYACPQSDLAGVNKRAVRFNAINGDELTSTSKITLSGTSFSVSYWMRRDRINTNDVALSLGTPAKRTFLSMGFDSENRVYCSFFGDDLRSTSWYGDQNWHHYICTFDKTTLVRQLYRDGVLIAQDVAGGQFTAPASALVIGRRNDNASGFVGSIDTVIIHKIALTEAQSANYPNLPSTDRIVDIGFDDIALQSIAPNRTRLECMATMPCPVVMLASHDDHALQFSGSEQMQLSSNPILTNGFTIAYWAQRSASSLNTVIMQGTTTAKRFTTGFNVNNTAYCAIGTTKVSSSAPSDTNWHLYVCIFNKTTGTLGLSVDAGTPQTVLSSYTDSGALLVGRAPESNSGFQGNIDDVFVYGGPLSHGTIGLLYNSTNPVSIVQTATPNPATPSVTVSPTFTITPTATSTTTQRATKTALPATATNVIVYATNTINPSLTTTPTRTNTLTRTVTATRTPTRSLTPTVTTTPTASKSATMSLTPTITRTYTATSTSTPTPFNGVTYTPSNTRTPLMLTRTYLAKQSPTYFAQTRTATWFAIRATQTSAALTQTAIPTTTYQARLTQTAAIIQTLTAYPFPSTPTRSSTPYPLPKSIQANTLLWPDITHLYQR